MVYAKIALQQQAVLCRFPFKVRYVLCLKVGERNEMQTYRQTNNGTITFVLIMLHFEGGQIARCFLAVYGIL